jgi:hypothetical protein
MKVAEAQARLEELLSKEGFSLDSPDLRIAWAGFKAFVLEPVDCAHDGVLFECGVYSWTGQELFYFGFVRQFTVDVDGDYDHMEQLHCQLSRLPTDELRLLETNLWLETFGKDYKSYFAAVEALPQFRKAIVLTGWKCEIYQAMV